MTTPDASELDNKEGKDRAEEDSEVKSALLAVVVDETKVHMDELVGKGIEQFADMAVDDD